MMFTYFLERNDRKSVWELCARPRGLRQSYYFVFLNVPANEQTIDGYMELHEMSVYGESEESVSGSIKRKGHSKKSREV